MKRILSFVIMIVMVLSLGLVATSCNKSQGANTNRRPGTASTDSTASDNGNNTGSNASTGSNGSTASTGSNGSTASTGSNGSTGTASNNGPATTPSGIDTNLTAEEIAALTTTGDVSVYSGISVAGVDGFKGYEGWWQDFNKYFQENWGGKINVIENPWSEWHKKYYTDYAAGTAPELVQAYEQNWPLVANRGYLWSVPQLKANGVVALDNPALTDYNAYKESVSKFYTFNNEVYAFAACSNDPDMVFVNEDLFKANNATSPTDLYKQGKWTLKTFFESARAVTKDINNDGKLDTFGAFTWDPYMLIAANGGQLVKIDGSNIILTLDDAKNKAVLEMYRTAVFEHESVLGVNKGDIYATNKWHKGELGMKLWLPHNEINKNAGNYIPDYKFEVTMIPMPRGDDNKTGLKSVKSYGWVVSKSADTVKRQQAAVNYVMAYNTYVEVLGHEMEGVPKNQKDYYKVYSDEERSWVDKSRETGMIPVHSGIGGIGYSEALFVPLCEGQTVQEVLASCTSEWQKYINDEMAAQSL